MRRKLEKLLGEPLLQTPHYHGVYDMGHGGSMAVPSDQYQRRKELFELIELLIDEGILAEGPEWNER